MEKKNGKVDGALQRWGRSGGSFKMVVRVGLFQTVRFTETWRRCVITREYLWEEHSRQRRRASVKVQWGEWALLQCAKKKASVTGAEREMERCACTYVRSVTSNPLRPKGLWPPGFSADGIFQANILEEVAISFSRGSSQSTDQTHISCISRMGRQILYQLSHLKVKMPWRDRLLQIPLRQYHDDCLSEKSTEFSAEWIEKLFKSLGSRLFGIRFGMVSKFILNTS